MSMVYTLCNALVVPWILYIDLFHNIVSEVYIFKYIL